MWFPRHGESSRIEVLPTREPRNPLLSMMMPSTRRIRGHAISHYPILWEKREMISAGFQKANTGNIEWEIVIVVKDAVINHAALIFLIDEYLRDFDGQATCLASKRLM
ncbi:hypothetical protein F5B19DRAFT_9855 [Rostrohypoxylon terebratum]|nr:hypothetical protein F5B19DRAFT_9855 [Rostrohypoxylon terebratum]